MLKPFSKSCKAKLRDAGITDTVRTASRACPDTSSSSRGCPRNIPSVSDHNAQQTCAGGDGFWPVGSVCGVTCQDGPGGHRRAQSGGSTYLCTQGGNWLSVDPISCAGAPPPPPPPPGGSRFVIGPEKLPIAQAEAYCRANYVTLASIHSVEESHQATAACAAKRTEEDQWVGCWIGFTCVPQQRPRADSLFPDADLAVVAADRDEASEGGYVWSDGTNIDFVNWAPGEPNDATDYEDGAQVRFLTEI